MHSRLLVSQALHVVFGPVLTHLTFDRLHRTQAIEERILGLAGESMVAVFGFALPAGAKEGGVAVAEADSEVVVIVFGMEVVGSAAIVAVALVVVVDVVLVDTDGSDTRGAVGITVAVGIIGVVVMMLVGVATVCRHAIPRQSTDRAKQQHSNTAAVPPEPPRRRSIMDKTESKSRW